MTAVEQAMADLRRIADKKAISEADSFRLLGIANLLGLVNQISLEKSDRIKELTNGQAKKSS